MLKTKKKRKQIGYRRIIFQRQTDQKHSDPNEVSNYRKYLLSVENEKYPTNTDIARNSFKAQEISLGPNHTKIDKDNFDNISWISAEEATHLLLTFIFDINTLATHSLVGTERPLFMGRRRPPKLRLDPLKVADIIHCVVSRTGEKVRNIRNAILTKCLEESMKQKAKDKPGGYNKIMTDYILNKLKKRRFSKKTKQTILFC